MTKLEQINKIINDFVASPNSQLLKYPIEAPEFVSLAYNKICDSILNHYRIFKEAALLLKISPSVFEEFERNNPNLRESVVIGGGVISDFIMHRELNIEYAPKDIDIFVQKSIPDFFEKVIEIGISSDPYFDYDLHYEMTYLGLNGLSNYVESDEVKNLPSGYVIFSYALTEVLDTNTSEWVYNHHYNMDYVHYLERGTINERDTEIIICEDNKIFNFDLIFKNCYYTNNQIYVLDITLNDIKNRVIHIANATSAFTTLVRALYFEEKFGFTIDSLSFNALLEFIHSRKYYLNHFIEDIWEHPKCTNHVRQRLIEIFDIPNVCLISKPAKPPIFLSLKDFKNESADVFDYTYSFSESSMFFNKVYTLLKNLRDFKKVKCVFKRPTNWHNSLFTNELKLITFSDWYQTAFLYDKIAPISSHKDFLLKLITSKNPNKDFSTAKEINYKELRELEKYLSILIKSDVFNFTIGSKQLFDLLFRRISNCNELIVEFDKHNKLLFANDDSKTYAVPEPWINSMNNFFSQLQPYPKQHLTDFNYKDYL